MKKSSGRPKLFIGLLIFLVLQGFWQEWKVYPFWREHYKTKTGDISKLSPEQLLVALAGFREMIAGILWVKADSFFEEGNYDAILPIIRLVTILDPHQIDVYATGMWHVGYNFTDQEQRSDRRYIPAAIALGKEGCANNPETYELFYETGWLWYHKVMDDFPQAVKYLQLAGTKEDMELQPARKNLLAWAYQRNGQIDEALQYFLDLHQAAEGRFSKDAKAFSNRQNRDTIENNLDVMLVRMSQRGYFAKKGGYFEANKENYDIYPPFDVGFSARVTVEEPQVLRVEGTWNVQPVGTRIRFILRDKDYPNAKVAGLDWNGTSAVDLDPPKDLTYLQDDLYVKQRRFNKRIDMSRDPGMYPCISKDYVIEFFYSPRVAPPHIQDKFSWSGEGMTDKNFLNEEVRPGQRVMYTTLTITRDQLKRQGEWAPGLTTPVIMTKNYTPAKSSQTSSDIISSPSMRAK